MKTGAFLFLVVVSCCWMQQTDAFVPNSVLDILVRSINNEDVPPSLTHTAITEEAILQVAADVLKDNPNPDPNVDSTTRIDQLGELSTDNLIEAYFGKPSRRRTRKFEEAIDEINDANVRVDLGKESELAAAHFDSEQIQAGQNRLVELRQLVSDEIKSENYEAARRQTGRMLHTLQDFYSHSNWVEMGNSAPYSVLGTPGQNPENIASPNTQTCTNCVQGEEINFPGNITAMFHYQCKCYNNICEEINQNRILTSGYYSGLVDSTPQHNEIPKPVGKCSHGGFLDRSSDLPATGGINKDCTAAVWACHADLHYEAAQVAIMASAEILQNIRQDVNDDTKFTAFLNLDIQVVASLAYVIDTSGSMGPELPVIQATIPNIRVTLENYVESLGGEAKVRFILVPFNDPDPGTTIVTEDIDQFLNAIAALHPSGGGDCPEPGVGAIIQAIQASEAGSPVYVFTDASASDEDRLGELQALINKKRTPVNPVLSGICSSGKRSIHSQQTHQRWRRQTSSVGGVYELIAAYTGGQVFGVQPSEISDLSAVIGLSIERSFTTVLRMTGTSSHSGTLHFPVDETVNKVVISLNAGSVFGVTVTTPAGNDPRLYQDEVPSTTSYITTINVSRSDAILYGLWQLDFSFRGSYSIQISALSDLTFTYRLYRVDPTARFSFSTVEGKPLEGESLLLLVETAGIIEGTSFDRAALRDVYGEAIQSLILTASGKGTYYASFFMPPVEFFQIQILGMDSSGNAISRFSSSGVQVWAD